MSKALSKSDKANFNTLQRAFDQGDVCLVSSVRKSDGKPVSLVCAVSFVDGEYAMSPLAVMVEGNPFEDFEAPL